MINKSLKQLGAMLQGKEISSVELTQEYLNRIHRLNPEINAYITIDADKSLAQAKHADAMLAAGKGTALTGLPIAQKDIFVANDSVMVVSLENFASILNGTLTNKATKWFTIKAEDEELKTDDINEYLETVSNKIWNTLYDNKSNFEFSHLENIKD